MIKQNMPEFEKCNITTWHKAGFKGKGGVVVVLDDNGRPHEHTRVIEPFNDSHDKVNHKTNVCSVIREVAPDSTIYAFNWFAGHKEEIVAWIKEHELEIDAINCSFSGRVSMDVFEKLEDVDIPIITASGNSGYDNKVNDVARYDWTIAVGAWLEHNDQKASYSNSGEDLDIVSYTNIYITTSDGYDRLMYFNGTSCAAPMVSGMLAIYNGWLKENGLMKLSREEAKGFILDNVIDKDKRGFDVYSGNGLFILPKSIPEIKPIPEEDKQPEPTPEEEYIMADFKDTRNHWAKPYIDFVADQGLMKGYEEGVPGPEDDLFRPDEPMTRAEVATVIARMNGFVKKKVAKDYQLVEVLLDFNTYSRAGAKMKDIRGIAIHWVANPGSDAMDNRNYFNSLQNQATVPRRYASSHEIIGLDGEVVICVPKDEVAFHAGAKSYKLNAQVYLDNAPNRHLYGIEVCHPDWSGKFGVKTYYALLDRVSDLLIEFGLKPSRYTLWRHYDVTGKDCPKYYVQTPGAWDQLINDITYRYNTKVETRK